jgi:predicted ATP-grasp superfamily ATP-dependent carboligase
MLARVRVLVTGGEHVGPLATLRALRQAGHEPWAFVPDRAAYAAWSRAVAQWRVAPDPAADPQAFVAAVAEADVDVVLPGTEPALVVLAGRDEELAPRLVGAPPPDRAARATDKSLLPALAAAAGLETPPTVETARAEAPAAARELGYPVIVKPLRSDVGDTADGALAHGIPQRADDERSLADALAALPGERVLVQPFLDAALTAACGVAWDGDLVCAVHQASRRIWPPQIGISAFAETIARDDALETGVARLLAELGWSGIFQAQFVRARGRAYLIDLNPRPYGSLALAVAAGANLPAMWVDLLRDGVTRRPTGYRVGAGYRSEERDVQAIAHLFRHGPRRDALRALLPRRGTTHAIAQLRDPLPALGSLAKLR